jgi:SAM-dependent methyltransferase
METSTNEIRPPFSPAEGDAISAGDPRGSLQPPVQQTLIYGIAIFASAFFLFQVQPLITKIILPWFGGVAAVWTVCLVFFQVALLLGYLYAHLLTTRISLPKQGRIHAVLLALSLIALPILPRSSFKPSGSGDPTWHILMLLAVTIGLPYLVLSSTSPLLQAWYTQSRAGAVPYRFYALSNAGSMLALISYPVLVEPKLTSLHQAWGWSFAYAAVAAVCVALALRPRSPVTEQASSDTAGMPDWKIQTLWVALALCGASLLLAVTNHVSQNIASVPFLWVIPLSLYLLSFILCFDRKSWYRRNLFLRLLGIALGGMAYALDPSFAVLPMKVLIPVYCAGLWVCCMFCHGELARLKPHPTHLTSFYLMISLGGATGAVLAAIVAPHVFSGYYELQCAVGLCALLVLAVQFHDPNGVFDRKGWQPAGFVQVALVMVLLASLAISIREQKGESRRTERNFYGVLRVADHEGADARDGADSGKATKTAGQTTGHAPLYLSPYQTSYRRLINGTIDHGLQFLSPEFRRKPTTYYAANSGVGIALRAIAGRGALRVGVVGLGAGTLAAYGRPHDVYQFYEINPLDVQIAKEEFTFLSDSAAQIDLVSGDARLSLEGEAPQEFDALVVDAFSSDSIPVHLLTREAFELYFRHVKPDGLLAIHVSNQYLNLTPVVEAAAASLKKEAVIINNNDDHAQGVYAASWIVLGNSPAFYGHQKIEESGTILPPARQGDLWTDNYSSLFRILK